MDKYFDIINYLDTTKDTRSEILKKLSSFVKLKLKSDEIILINQNNKKKYTSSEMILVDVLEYAKNNNRIGINDFINLYDLIYQLNGAPKVLNEEHKNNDTIKIGGTNKKS